MHFSTIATLLVSSTLPLAALSASAADTTADGHHHHFPKPILINTTTVTGMSQPFNLTTGSNFTMFLNSTDAVKGKNASNPGTLGVTLVGADANTQSFTSDTFFKKFNKVTVPTPGNYAVNVVKINGSNPLTYGMFFSHHHHHHNGTAGAPSPTGQ